MKKAKKFLSVLLTVFLLAGCLPMAAWAAEGTTWPSFWLERAASITNLREKYDYYDDYNELALNDHQVAMLELGYGLADNTVNLSFENINEVRNVYLIVGKDATVKYSYINGRDNMEVADITTPATVTEGIATIPVEARYAKETGRNQIMVAVDGDGDGYDCKPACLMIYFSVPTSLSEGQTTTLETFCDSYYVPSVYTAGFTSNSYAIFTFCPETSGVYDITSSVGSLTGATISSFDRLAIYSLEEKYYNYRMADVLYWRIYGMTSNGLGTIEPFLYGFFTDYGTNTYLEAGVTYSYVVNIPPSYDEEYERHNVSSIDITVKKANLPALMVDSPVFLEIHGINHHNSGSSFTEQPTADGWKLGSRRVATFTPSVSGSYTFSILEENNPSVDTDYRRDSEKWIITNSQFQFDRPTIGAGGFIEKKSDAEPTTGVGTLTASLTAGETYYINVYSEQDITAVVSVELTKEDPNCECPNCDSEKCTCTENCTDGGCECEGCQPEIPDEPECGCDEDCNCSDDCGCETGDCNCAGCPGNDSTGGNPGGGDDDNPGGTPSGPSNPSTPSGPSDTENPDDPGETPSASKFTDVAVKEYYYNAVNWAVENNIVAGTSDTTFSPNQNCTRGQIVSFLWRAAGKPEPKTTVNPFTDVKSSEYYYKAVLWAYENNIVAGTGATTFSPNQNCTRGQIVTFLWRSAEKPEPKISINPFSDVKSGEYYYKAVLWSHENKIVAGTSDTNFSPNQSCTRAQAVTFMYRDMGK